MNLTELEKSTEKLKEQNPDIYKDTMKISVPFFILHKKVYEEGNNALNKQYNLNQTDLDVLVTLYYCNDNHTLSPTELYENLLFSSGGMTKILKKLESKNYLIRIENENDKRSKLVQLTNLGKEQALKAIKEVISIEDMYFNKLNNDEKQNFRELLYKILN